MEKTGKWNPEKKINTVDANEWKQEAQPDSAKN